MRSELHTKRAATQAPDPQVPIDAGGFAIPPALHLLAERLVRSRAMLDLEDGWDGDGSPGYEESRWRRAAELAITASVAHFQRTSGEVVTPLITKGDDGSIDLQWRTPTRNVLINVPAEADEVVSFYAHDREDSNRDVGGTLDASTTNEWLLAWLTA